MPLIHDADAKVWCLGPEAMGHALTSARCNKSEAAMLLHWSRMTLYRKMSRHGIELERHSDGACN